MDEERKILTEIILLKKQLGGVHSTLYRKENLYATEDDTITVIDEIFYNVKLCREIMDDIEKEINQL